MRVQITLPRTSSLQHTLVLPLVWECSTHNLLSKTFLLFLFQKLIENDCSELEGLTFSSLDIRNIIKGRIAQQSIGAAGLAANEKFPNPSHHLLPIRKQPYVDLKLLHNILIVMNVFHRFLFTNLKKTNVQDSWCDYRE